MYIVVFLHSFTSTDKEWAEMLSWSPCYKYAVII
jgi:hypothetical protein